ncbi:MAG TPA: hypothetical protein VIL63_10890, partial [Terriglobales bacterium]
PVVQFRHGVKPLRRHRRDCKAGHSEDTKSSDLEERKKGWRQCGCPIFASGSIDRNFRRQSTGQWEWADAKTIAVHWEASQSWDGKPKALSAGPAKEQSCIAIKEAIGGFIATLIGDN